MRGRGGPVCVWATAGGLFCKAFALHEVTSETESRARLVKNEACDPKHLGDFGLSASLVATAVGQTGRLLPEFLARAQDKWTNRH